MLGRGVFSLYSSGGLSAFGGFRSFFVLRRCFVFFTDTDIKCKGKIKHYAHVT